MPGRLDSRQLAWLIKRHGIEMTHLSGGSHIGSILSVADILAVLYVDILNFDTLDPGWQLRDRVILSKGHAGAALYAALAESGFFDPEELKTHYADGSRLSGHVSHKVPGVDFSTGSLGHGLSAGAGMALAARKDGRSNRTYVILGDGECNEGSVWEAALFAAHFQLGRLTAIVDHNRMQSLDYCERILKLSPLADKWRAFGWDTTIVDGHDHKSLCEALKPAAIDPDRPTAIIAETVKGHSISFMENNILWHYRFPHPGWEYDQAVDELHAQKPAGVIDPYTPTGIIDPQYPSEEDQERNDGHALGQTWRPHWKAIGES